MRTVPPRLHVLLARNSTRALVLARVRNRLYCTIGWDRQGDRFEVGQWLKARIYPLRCDLSPDGSLFVYFVLDGRRMARGESEAYTAVARTPYLKALLFFTQIETWHGGGLFVDDRALWVNGSCGEGSREMPGLDLVGPPAPFKNRVYEDPRVYFPRLVRDGWTEPRAVEQSPEHDVYVFEKRLPTGGTLEKSFHGTSSGKHEEGRGCYYEEHAILTPRGERLDHADWEWADLDADRGRVLFANAGRVHAAPLEGAGAGPPRVLFDAGTLAFEAIEAPY
jgi:hypothetical protein